MSDSDVEEIKLDLDSKPVCKTSPSSPKSGRSWMGDNFCVTTQAKVESLAEEANNKNIQKTMEETSITGISKNNQRRLFSAPSQKKKQSSGKMLRNVASAKPKYFSSDSKCSNENLAHSNLYMKGSAIFDPISFHSIAGVSSDKSGFLSLRRNLEPICLKTIQSRDSCKNNLYDMHITDNKKKFSAEMSRSMFFPSSKPKPFPERVSNVPTEASSCFSSEESSYPFESSEFRENRLKCKRKKHFLNEESGMKYYLHKCVQTEPETNISLNYRQREYEIATCSYYKTTPNSYVVPFAVFHCGTQTEISCFTSRDAQFFEPEPSRSVSNQWFMLHKATNTSNENCSILEKTNEHSNMSSENFLHLKIQENDESNCKGRSHNHLHKSSENNASCGNSCFSRLFSCCC